MKKLGNKRVIDLTKSMMKVLKPYPKGSIAELIIKKGRKKLVEGTFSHPDT